MSAETLTESEVCEPKNLKEFKDFKDLSQRGASDFFDQKSEQPPVDAPVDSEKLINFVVETVGRGANNPRAYAKAAIKNDREYWEAEFKRSLELSPRTPIEPKPLEAEPFGEQKSPGLEPVNDRDQVLGRAAAFLEMGKHPNMAEFARKKLTELIQRENIRPEELRAYLAQKSGVSVDVASPWDVPSLAGSSESDRSREISDRLKAAQWAAFEQGVAF